MVRTGAKFSLKDCKYLLAISGYLSTSHPAAPPCYFKCSISFVPYTRPIYQYKSLVSGYVTRPAVLEIVMLSIEP